MEPSPDPPRVEAPPKKKPAWVGCLILLGVGFLLFVVLPAAVLISWSIQGARQVEAQLANIRARGEPASAQELASYYAIPQGQEDVTDRWLAALGGLDNEELGRGWSNLPAAYEDLASISLPPETWDELGAARELLQQFEAELEEMHAAAAAGGAARYPVNFEDGLAMLLPHAQSLRDCVRLLALEAYVRAHDGDAKGAAESIRAMQAAARSLDQEPIMVSQLVRIACDGIARDTLRKTLPAVDYSEEDLAAIQQRLLAVDDRQAFGRSLRGERALGIIAFEDPVAALGEDAHVPTSVGIVGGNTDLSFYLSTMEKLIAAADKPWLEARAGVQEVHEEYITTVHGSPLARLRHVVSMLLFPATEAMFKAAARGDTSNKAAAAAIGVELFRREHGRAPSGLEELVPKYLPAVPLDPYDGKPLKYVVGDDSYRIYGIGHDLKDDGGVMDPQSDGPDIVFEVEMRKVEE